MCISFFIFIWADSCGGCFTKLERGILCYDDHDDDDDDDECVEDEICDFENFQLNEIESFFPFFPGGLFSFFYCCNICDMYIVYMKNFLEVFLFLYVLCLGFL